MTKTELREQALQLPAKERYDLAEALWDSIPPEDQVRLLPVHGWQKDALDEAIRDLEQNPEAGIPADEAMAQVREETSRRA